MVGAAFQGLDWGKCCIFFLGGSDVQSRGNNITHIRITKVGYEGRICPTIVLKKLAFCLQQRVIYVQNDPHRGHFELYRATRRVVLENLEENRNVILLHPFPIILYYSFLLYRYDSRRDVSIKNGLL